MLPQRIFQGTSATSAPFPILETTSPCGPEKAIFSSAFTVNCLGAAARLSIAGWTGSRKKNSFFCWNEAGMLLITKEIISESGNVREKKGGIIDF
jgi:hypothetical protein